jgi:hypothetical protein
MGSSTHRTQTKRTPRRAAHGAERRSKPNIGEAVANESFDVTSVRRCIEVRREHIVRAAASREQCGALLEHCASISRPNTGCPIVLLLFARLATTACEWMDGALRVQGLGYDDETAFQLLLEVGLERYERVLPPFVLRAPLSEFVGLIERIPRVIEPLTFARPSRRRILLTASAEIRKSTVPPPSIDERSLFEIDVPPYPKR